MKRMGAAEPAMSSVNARARARSSHGVPNLPASQQMYPTSQEMRMDDRDRPSDSTDARVERAKDAALGKHDSNPSHVDEAGEALGSLGGVLAGAAVGAAGGPLGVIIGGVAGAVGGW